MMEKLPVTAGAWRRASFTLGLLITATLATMSAQSGNKATADGAAKRDPTSTQVEMLPDAPDFRLQTLQGKVIRLADYRGKAVLLNFWATWCVPCKEEIPWLVDFQKQYGPKGLVILGIAMDSSIDPVKKFTTKLEVNYPILLGNQALADQYYVKALPVSVFIDRNGRMTDQVPGAASRSFIENEIRLALENGSQSPAK